MSRDLPLARPASLDSPSWLPGGDLQTVVPGLLPAPDWPAPIETRYVQVAPDNQVQLRVSRPAGSPRGTVVLVHGLGGSTESHYLVASARYLLGEGWVVVRMNLRNCGGTADRATTLYNAGQADDLGRVLETLDDGWAPSPRAAIGFSLGGNLTLLHAGRAGEDLRVDAVVAVSPPVELDACLRRVEQPRNRVYELNFVHKICKQLRHVESLRPLPGPSEPTWPAIRRLRRLDHLYTAPDAGFPTAEAYYEASSSGPWLASIRRPTTILSAVNDPIIEADRLEGHARPGLTVSIASSGGHCGFWQRRGPRRDWLGATLADTLRMTLT